MTIGIQGDWGIGKTSLLNMIAAYLKSKNAYGLIWFNTWHYSMFGQEEFLGVAVIKGLLDQIKSQFSIKEENDFFKNANERLGMILKSTRFSAFGLSIGGEEALGKKTSQVESLGYQDISSVMLDFKDNFEKLIQHIIDDITIDGNKIEKVVFFIDDLDRVKPVKALELLESIKNFLDVKDCVFILAVDYEVVQIGMAEKLGKDLQKTSGKSFFDKIIQLPFTMPSTSYKLENYIQVLLKNADSRFNPSKDDLGFYEGVTSVTIGKNPRSIKRVINYISLIRKIEAKGKSESYKGIRDSEDRRKILYSIICMQVAWPEIFAHFVKSPTANTIKSIENWDYLNQIPFIDKLYNRTPNKEQLKSNISAYFDILFDLLDKDDSGQISKAELKPVWGILQMARLTNVKDFRQPIDIFFDNMEINCNKKDKDGTYLKIRDLLKKSKWLTSAKIDYKMSGKRYATIVHNRKQIGSLVTLKTQPFIFRLGIDENMIIDHLSQQFKDELDIENIITIISDDSLTGFGTTLVDMKGLAKIDGKLAIKFLNLLHDFIILT